MARSTRSRIGSSTPCSTKQMRNASTCCANLLRLRNAAAPLVNVCRRLEHAEVMSIDPAMQPLFRDVTDHVRRVQEEIDVLREVLAFAFEANLMNGQAEQTSITRRLAARPPFSQCRPRSPASTA